MRESRKKPLFIFDGDCGFCRYWMRRWKEKVGDKVDFEPYQKVHENFPEISIESFRESSMLVLPSGEVWPAAKGIFKMISYKDGKGFLWFCYRYIPLFGFLSERFYYLVSRNRPFFSKILNFFVSNEKC